MKIWNFSINNNNKITRKPNIYFFYKNFLLSSSLYVTHVML